MARTLVASDNFNRADESPLSGGGNWATVTGFNNFRIVSNQVTQVTEPSDTAARYSGVTWPDDQWSQVTIADATLQNGGPAVRMNTSGTASSYVFVVVASEYRIYRISSGSATSIASAAGTFANGDVLYLEIQGTTLIAKKNGVQVLTVTDATHSAGGAGIHGFSVSALDDWSAGDFLSSSPAPVGGLQARVIRRIGA